MRLRKAFADVVILTKVSDMDTREGDWVFIQEILNSKEQYHSA